MSQVTFRGSVVKSLSYPFFSIKHSIVFNSEYKKNKNERQKPTDLEQGKCSETPTN